MGGASHVTGAVRARSSGAFALIPALLTAVTAAAFVLAEETSLIIAPVTRIKLFLSQFLLPKHRPSFVWLGDQTRTPRRHEGAEMMMPQVHLQLANYREPLARCGAGLVAFIPV